MCHRFGCSGLSVCFGIIMMYLADCGRCYIRVVTAFCLVYGTRGMAAPPCGVHRPLPSQLSLVLWFRQY